MLARQEFHCLENSCSDTALPMHFRWRRCANKDIDPQTGTLFVFQCLPHTMSVGTDIWRVLAVAHDVRNGFEYEGSEEVTEDLSEQVIRCAKVLEKLS